MTAPEVRGARLSVGLPRAWAEDSMHRSHRFRNLCWFYLLVGLHSWANGHRPDDPSRATFAEHAPMVRRRQVVPPSLAIQVRPSATVAPLSDAASPPTAGLLPPPRADLNRAPVAAAAGTPIRTSPRRWEASPQSPAVVSEVTEGVSVGRPVVALSDERPSQPSSSTPSTDVQLGDPVVEIEP